MVASISARGSAQAALGYYGHLGQDDYYLRGREPPSGEGGGSAVTRRPGRSIGIRSGIARY